MSRLTRYALVLSTAALAACGVAEEPPTQEDEGWSCSEERDEWERCDGASVVWCHAAVHGGYSAPHFHEGTNCGEDAFECVELDDRTAACADPDSSCEDGWSECDGREARNCVEGRIATMRCSLTESCESTDEGARCVSTQGG